MSVINHNERPDGARNVYTWTVYTSRTWELIHVLVEDKGGDHRIETTYADTPSHVETHVIVQFWDDESAREFEAKVRAMLPEPG